MKRALAIAVLLLLWPLIGIALTWWGLRNWFGRVRA